MWITLATDFGTDSPYVAAMKGVLLGVNPAAQILDLGHQIPPQDVRHSAFFLASCVPCFPTGSLHVVVVDPGVGTDRAILYAEVVGQRLLAPDNGCLGLLFDKLGKPSTVRRVRNELYMRPPISTTFHGRDIFAPVAGHLSLGVDPALLGPETPDWVRLEFPYPVPIKNGIKGEVVFVDSFGNLITNISKDLIDRSPSRLKVGRRWIDDFTWVLSYAECRPGQIALLISSGDLLELAVVQGNAAQTLRAAVGTPLAVGFD